MLKDFHHRDMQIRPAVAELLGEWWAPQVSLALTCADLGLPTLALPMRYNFPNDRRADAMYSGELEFIAFLHYLRREQFQRETIFADEDPFAQFLELPLTGSDLEFQKAVWGITGGRYPFSR